MEATTATFTSLYTQTNSKKSLSSSKALLGRFDICLLQRLKSNVHHPSVSLRHKAFQSVASYRTQFSRGLEKAGISNYSKNSVMTVTTKFQLHKECNFGEHFLLVGNEPIIAMWNPSKAVPLNWSHGNIWTTEINIKVDSPIQYKFILKQSSGEIVWQPGPDRNFRAWKTSNPIIVVEDWENASLQKITEEKTNNNGDAELLVNHNRQLTDAENVRRIMEEVKLTVKKSKKNFDGDAELLVNHDRQLTDAENVRRIIEEVKLTVKKSKKIFESAAGTDNDSTVGEKTEYSTEGTLKSAHMGVSSACGDKKEVSKYKNKPRTSRRKFLASMEDEDLGIHEEGFVLVPGLKHVVS